MRRDAARIFFLGLLVLVWPALAAAPAAPAAPQDLAGVRQLLEEAAVRIDVEGARVRGVCTGWIGWTEESQSAAYTAAHCYREGASYRITLRGGEPVYATGFMRWDDLDLMALWLPRGRLRALRGWKRLPPGPFHAVYVLNDRGAGLRLVDAPVPRVYWEIRFENHPVAVALPLYSAPGTSGAPVVDAADGLLVGMVVGFVSERPDVAAVVPAQEIYDLLVRASR
ncbi:MAG: hypothetical protein QN141_05920 [Armatimonadota bacterium]|nr:hypothetical protein [Armatimonadota bacterium]MDR7451965.1 hypothetical protein [Armatimonadota bacterium]MDR7466647.1 hypothetical protein [Armatimonadota bacterium]MDR7492879.1 hypothetical protein [Armatimonadota bacterium]MDR7498655.1 hypothetical protein [Armatimonadota bacterium]